MLTVQTKPEALKTGREQKIAGTRLGVQKASRNTAVAAADHDQPRVPQLDPLLVRNIALYAAEAVFCGRPVAHLGTYITNTVAAKLNLQRQVSDVKNRRKTRITWAQGKSLAHIYKTNETTSDCVVTLIRDGTTFAVALRLKYDRQKWRAVELTII